MLPSAQSIPTTITTSTTATAPTNWMRMNISEQMHGVAFCHQIHSPTYLEWKKKNVTCFVKYSWHAGSVR